MNAADEAARRFPNDMGHGSTNGPGALTSASFPIKLRRGDFAAGAAWQRSQPIEEPGEWEYGLVNPESLPGEYGRDDRAHLVSGNREHVERQHRRGHPSIQFVRRRKAGSWEEVND